MVTPMLQVPVPMQVTVVVPLQLLLILILWGCQHPSPMGLLKLG